MRCLTAAIKNGVSKGWRFFVLFAIMAFFDPPIKFMTSLKAILFVSVFLILTAGCTTTQPSGRPADATLRIMELQRELALRPDDTNLLRELGVLHVQSDRAIQGEPFLKQAYELGDRDPELLFYLGLATEMLVNLREAIPYYAQYTGMPRISRYRRYMQGRYQWLTRQVAQANMREKLRNERDLDSTAAPSTTIAVYSLLFQGTDRRYQPLGRGMAEMISMDLAQLPQLTIVERTQLQAILDELNISSYLNPSSAPRVGRILSAGRIVSGAYDVLDDNTLRVDLGAWHYETEELPLFDRFTDRLDNFHRFQKSLVFDLVGDFGITLTPEEQQRIEFIPTENLQAFLAFSQGLEEEDRANYAIAAGHYRRAATLDPEFRLAIDRAEAAESMQGMNGSIALALEFVLQGDMESPPTIDLLSDRLVKLRAETGLDIPLEETGAREPAVEAAGSLGAGLGEAPPPPRGNN